MKLYGTTTSPFVRRVRIVALEAGADFELIDTATDDGQAALRRITPAWKVPVIEAGGQAIFDSRVIVDWIVASFGWGRLAPPRDRWQHANLLSAIDAALDSAIQVFYLRRDGLDVATMPFAHRQRDRITAIFDWLAVEQTAGRFGAGPPGLAEVSLGCTLDWMAFRDTYDVASLGDRFAGVRAALDARASVISTRPPT